MRMTEFQCYRRIGKAEYFGTVSMSPEQLTFTSLTSPSASIFYSLDIYVAQRQHPKMPMLQLRFTPSGGSPEDITLLFKNPLTGAHDFNLLRDFLIVFNGSFQALRGASESVSSILSTSISSTASTAVLPPVLSPLEESSFKPPTIIPTSYPTSKAQPPLITPLPITPRLLPSSLSSSSEIPISLPQPLQQERQCLLDEDEELKSAYEFLVINGFVTETQFWDQHEVEFLSLQSQPPGIVSDDCFLLNPLAHATQTAAPKPGDKKEAFAATTIVKASLPKVTQQQLEQIVNEHPPIRALYAQIVPVKVSSDEFWSRFFQSRYYFQMTGCAPPPGADEAIFPDFDPDLLLKIPSAPEVQRLVAPSLDLIAADQFNKPGGRHTIVTPRTVPLLYPGFGSVLGRCSLVGETSRAPSRSQRSALLDRFNRHALGIVRDLETRPGRHLHLRREKRLNHTRPSSDVVEKRRRILRNDTFMEDLERPEVKAVPLLQLTSVEPSGPSQRRDISNIGEKARDSLVQRLREWVSSSQSDSSLPDEEAKFMFTLNTRLIQKELQKQDDRKIQELLQQEQIRDLLHRVAVHQSRLRELFQHFWQTGLFERDKQERLATAIRSTMTDISITMTQLKSSTDRQTSAINSRALYQPLLEACKAALSRYDALKTSTMPKPSISRSALTAGLPQNNETRKMRQ